MSTNDKTGKKEENKKRKYRDTVAKQNTRAIIYSIIDKYDDLLKSDSADAPELARKYQIKLRNKTRLANAVHEYYETNDIEEAVTSDGKIRELITDCLDKGSLIIVDGLIRRPHNISLEETTATGNVFTIMMPPIHISTVLSELTKSLYDFPVSIVAPCINMIMIIELGSYQEEMNNDLQLQIKKYLLEYAINHNLYSRTTSETTKYTLY